MKDTKSTFLSNIALSFLTPPTMLMFITEKTALELLENIGESAEEIFRGERLPILHNHEISKM